MSDLSMTYVALEPCGCVAGAVIDNPDHRADVAKELRKFARWTANGVTITRISTEEFRETARFGCDKCQAA